VDFNREFGLDYNQAVKLAEHFQDDVILADSMMDHFHHVQTNTGYVGVSYPHIAAELGHHNSTVEMAIRGRVDRFFRKLSDLGLVDWPNQDSNERSEYRVLSRFGEACRQDKSYRDLLFGPTYTANRTLPAVWFLEVENPGTGDIGQATCFHIGKGWFITCKHCVEPPQIAKVVDLDDQSRTWQVKTLRMSDKRDIAAFQVVELTNIPNLALAETASILEDVIVIHCPRVPRNDAVKVVSKGEINARGVDYGTKHESLLISPQTGPGSSGGPVLNRRGQVCGLVDQFLFEAPRVGEAGTPAMPFFHAIPVEEVREFLNEKVLNRN
jgi:S1-C subfamily serine protease